MTHFVHNARSNVKSKCTNVPCFLHDMTKSPDDRPDQAIRLVQARERRGFASQKAACQFFGWNYSSYQQHENGTRGIHRMAERYAAAYGVTPGWLLTGEGSIEKKRSIDQRISLLPVSEQQRYYQIFNDLLDVVDDKKGKSQ